MASAPKPWKWEAADNLQLMLVGENDPLEAAVLVCERCEACATNNLHCGWPTDEDAAFIVRACNAHDDLLAACKALVDYRDRAGALGFQLEKADDYINQLRAAIAAAEGGQG